MLGSFLKLDELKRARDKDTYDTMVETSRQFGQAPLVYDKMIKAEEDRKNKIAQTAIENKQKDAQLAETERNNKATNQIGTSKVGVSQQAADTAKTAEERRLDAQKQKQIQASIKPIVRGKLQEILAQSPDADDDTVVAGASAHPALQGIDPQTIRNAVYEARREMDKDNFTKETTKAKLDMEQQRIKAAIERANRPRAPKAPRERLVGEAFVNKVGEMRALQGKAVGILNQLETLDDSKVGLIEDLKEKYGSIVGIQDNQLRMEYASQFNQILKLRSGTAVTPSELERLEQEIPSWRAGKGVIADALARIIDNTDRDVELMEATQAAYGRTFRPSPSAKPKPKMTPEQVQAAVDAELDKLGL